MTLQCLRDGEKYMPPQECSLCPRPESLGKKARFEVELAIFDRERSFHNFNIYSRESGTRAHTKITKFFCYQFIILLFFFTLLETECKWNLEFLILIIMQLRSLKSL